MTQSKDEAVLERRQRMEQQADEMEKVAREHYIHDRKFIDIATDFDPPKHAGQLTAIKNEAVESGVVQFNVDKRFGLFGEEQQSVGFRLSGCYEINTAQVISVPLKPTYDFAEDDFLHMVLSNHAGNVVRGRIKSGDHIVVTGGRATFHLAKYIGRRPPTSRDLLIAPLSGRFWAHYMDLSGPHVMQPLDADDVASVLANAFEGQPGPPRFRTIQYPLFTESAERAMEVMKLYCPFEPGGGWLDGQPNFGIYGVGSIGPKSGHRISDIQRKDKKLKDVAQFLASAAGELDEAMKFAGDNCLSCGDLGNRFFPCLPLPSKIEGKDLKQYTEVHADFSKRLEDINSRMVVASWRHFQKVPFAYTVAGGPHKLNTLFTMLIAGALDRKKKMITDLCTDLTTAETLIKERERFDRSDAEVQRWYKDMVGTIFNAGSTGGLNRPSKNVLRSRAARA